MTSKFFKLAIPLLALSTVACTTNAPSPNTPSSDSPFVNQIRLSKTMGEVGRPFSASIELSAVRLGTPEMTVNNLPEGLYYSEETNEIVGVPASEGFFSVTVAVRQEQQKGMRANTIKSNWFTEDFEVAIYKPIFDESLAGEAEVATLTD